MTDSATPKLRLAYTLIKGNDKQQAAAILHAVLDSEPDNLQAWWLLAYAAPSPAAARRALGNVLRLNPEHDKARARLDALNRRYPPDAQPAAKPATSAPNSGAPNVARVYTAAPEAAPVSPRADPRPPTTPEMNWEQIIVPATDTPSAAAPPTAQQAKPSQSGATLGNALAAFLLAIPSGAYIGATVLVGEFVLVCVLTAVGIILTTLPTGTELLIFIALIAVGIFIVLTFYSFLLIILVPLGVVIGVVGAIGGAIFGAAVGLANMLCVGLVSLVYRPAVETVSLLFGGIMGVLVYHYLGYDLVLKVGESLTHPWIAGLNYVVTFLAGVLISIQTFAQNEPIDETGPAPEAGREPNDLHVLMAPWRFYGRIAKGVMGTGNVLNPLTEKRYYGGRWESPMEHAIREEEEKQQRSREDVRYRQEMDELKKRYR